MASRRALSAGGVLAAAVVALVLLLQGGDTGSDPSTTTSSSPSTATAAASSERDAIAATLALVETDGPFIHGQDGSTFQNREGHLPDQPEGYYREYTVETPGSDDRGARRLVIGDGGETYYTADHYDSFTRIDPEDFK